VRIRFYGFPGECCPEPVTEPSFSPPPSGEALEWVSRVLAVAGIMLMPGLAGRWLDGYFGLNFLMLVGFCFGFAIGMWYLLLMAKPRPPRKPDQNESTP
jgi:hypothetical protein